MEYVAGQRGDVVIIEGNRVYGQRFRCRKYPGARPLDGALAILVQALIHFALGLVHMNEMPDWSAAASVAIRSKVASDTV